MNPFFDELGALFVDEARKCGVAIDMPKLDPKSAEELLDLAKVVSHTRERRFAPLACYIAGLAVATAQAKQATICIADLIKAVRVALEPQEDSANSTR